MEIFFRSIFWISGMVTSIFLVVILFFTSVGDGSPDIDHVTGKVADFQKKSFWETLKKRI